MLIDATLAGAPTGVPTSSHPLAGGRRPAGGSDPLQVDLADVVELLGGEADERACAGIERFATQRVARGALLVHEGAPADSLYVVLAGSFKFTKTGEDGYEHVLGFVWRRDVIGFDGFAGGRYAFAAVALEDSRVVVLPRTGLRALRRRVDALDTALQVLVARQLARAGEIAEVMAAVAADARLARFLVQMSMRMAERGQSPRCLLLRMNRRDIAGYLGLAHETISRSFHVLAAAGWLRVADREVEILDLEALKRCARSTRGVDAPAARPSRPAGGVVTPMRRHVCAAA